MPTRTRGIPVDVARRFGAWAAAHESALELWLFGSRARGDHRADSDIDLAIHLAGPDGVAASLFIVREVDWEAELTRIARLSVDLQLIGFSDQLDEALAKDGVLLWSRTQETKKPGAP